MINVGCGEDLTIRESAEVIAEVVGFKGRLTFDSSKPDETPRKLLDISRLTALGWRPQTTLLEGLQRTYIDCSENIASRSQVPLSTTRY
jgi:GDP-L-fucose synthase